MKINREQFLSDLEMVKGGLSPREFIEQSSCFVFQNGMVMTFNDEVACRKKIGVQVTGAVQAQSLLDILSKLDDPELKIRENEKGELEFRGKKKGFGVTKDAEIFLPIDRVEMPSKWEDLPKEFTEAVGLVQHCASTDESRFILTCIHINPDYIEACNNLEILRVRTKTPVKKDVLVRAASLVQVCSLGMDKIALTESWIHFKNQAGLIFSCRKYSEDYPDLSAVTEVKGHSIKLPKGLIAASDRAEVFATDNAGDPHVTVSLSGGVIRVLGEGISGWYKEVKKIAYDGPPMEFLIKPELLKHITEKYSEAVLGDSKLKAVGGHWEYVTVLGVPSEKEEASKEEKSEE